MEKIRQNTTFHFKPFVIGRKNWLFSNTPKGADAKHLKKKAVICSGYILLITITTTNYKDLTIGMITC